MNDQTSRNISVHTFDCVWMQASMHCYDWIFGDITREMPGPTQTIRQSVHGQLNEHFQTRLLYNGLQQ